MAKSETEQVDASHHAHAERRKHSVEQSLVTSLLSRPVLDRQVEAIHELQKTFIGTPFGKALAQVSLLGSGKVVLIVLTIFFWLLRTNSWGPTRAASLVLSMVGIVKALFKGPRPYWLSNELKALDPTLEVSFGFPSGHTAAVAATYGFIAYREGYSQLAIAFLILIAVGVSRVFTAAHFFHDVAGGALLGLAVLAMLILLDSWSLSHRDLAMMSMFTSALTLTIVVAQYGIESIPFKLVQEGLSGSGFLLGLSLCHLSEEFIRASLSDTRGALPLVACVVGFSGIVLISTVIKTFHKHDDNLTLGNVLAICFLYAMINLWALWVLPILVDDYLLSPTVVNQ